MTHTVKTRRLVTTALDGNELYLLQSLGYRPGQLLVGNSVQALGVLKTLGAGVRNAFGGESATISELIKSGRDAALLRMEQEAEQVQACGVSSVRAELSQLSGNTEFLATGSALMGKTADHGSIFTSSFDGKQLFCAMDAGYTPVHFAFGNIAYSIGIGGGFLGGVKTMFRGEIPEYSNILNTTRHAALSRLEADARHRGANVVLGVETDLTRFEDFHEMYMTGTSAVHPSLPSGQVASCDLTCDELWSLAKAGYAPMKILMGTAVYALGVAGSIKAWLRSLKRGEIPELTSLVYDAREHALDLVEQQAESLGADFVAGTDVYVQELAPGVLEFLAVGTAVKACDASMAPRSNALPAQAVAEHRRTFRDSVDEMLSGDDERE